MKGLNVLSLCDGMSCGHIALEKAGFKVNNYYASEIKPIAIKVTNGNYPNTIQVGDVNKVTYKDGLLITENGIYEEHFDLVIFGSPCQSFSIAIPSDMRIGLQDMKRSGLFYECYRILKEVNPQYFLMENVVMKKEDEEIINTLLGVKPIKINSALLTAQNRVRNYWTNIPGVKQPSDLHIELQSVIKDGGYAPINKARCLTVMDSHGYYNGCNWNPIKRFHRTHYKAFSTMIYPSKEYFDNCVEITKKILNGKKSTAKAYDHYNGHDFDEARYLWKEERARLQGVPEEYIKNLSEKESADILGDGWTVPVISHIFSFMKF